MGGQVAIAVRHQGRVETRHFSTGNLALVVQDLAFLERGEGPGAEAWSWGTPAPLAPYGYGLVFIDRDTRWVGSCQNYRTPWLIGIGGLADEALDDAWSEVAYLRAALTGGALRRLRFGPERFAPLDALGWGPQTPWDTVLVGLLALSSMADARTSDQSVRWRAMAPAEFQSELQSALQAPYTSDGLLAWERLPPVYHVTFEPEGWTYADFPNDRPEEAYAQFLTALMERSVPMPDADAWFAGVRDYVPRPTELDPLRHHPAARRAQNYQAHLEGTLPLPSRPGAPRRM